MSEGRCLCVSLWCLCVVFVCFFVMSVCVSVSVSDGWVKERTGFVVGCFL